MENNTQNNLKIITYSSMVGMAEIRWFEKEEILPPPFPPPPSRGTNRTSKMFRPSLVSSQPGPSRTDPMRWDTVKSKDRA